MVKILSNFDTKGPAKHYAEAVQQYGFDKVIFIRRHKVYLRLYVVLPALLGALFAGGGVFFLLRSIGQSDTGDKIFYYVLAGVLLIVGIVILIYTLNRYFNYKLDYSIITPEYMAAYDQKGFFKRQTTTIEITKIKTVNFYSGGLLNSLFNFGRVDILLEGDNEGRGDISVDFVKNPEGIKYTLLQMMGIKDSEGQAKADNTEIPNPADTLSVEERQQANEDLLKSVQEDTNN